MRRGHSISVIRQWPERRISVSASGARAVYGLPTKLVTLWAPSEALKRPLLTVMTLLAAMLSVADVTQGVMPQGTTPEMNSESGVVLLLLLIATSTTVPSVGFR